MLKGKYGCSVCLKRGKRYIIKKTRLNRRILRRTIRREKHTTRIYPPNQNGELRTIELHNIIYDLLNNDNSKPVFGVKEKSIITNLINFNYIFGIHQEPMHYIFGGFVKRHLSLVRLNKYRDKLCYIESNIFQIINERLAKFPINNKFKRKIRTFNELDLYKFSSYLEWFFYLSLTTTIGLFNLEVYKHWFIIVYVISKFWNNDLNEEDIEMNNNLIKSYLDKVELYYSKQDYTPNLHQLEHLSLTYKKLGKLKYLTAFHFESENHNLVKKIKSPNHILEQLSNKYNTELSFNLIDEEKQSNNNDPVKLNKYIYNNLICYKKIILDNEEYSSFNNLNNRISKDYYVETKDKKFFKILYFYELNNLLYFQGEEILAQNFLSINYSDTKYNLNETELNLDHIIIGKQTKDLISINVNQIKEKVIFVPKFKNATSDLDLESEIGFIIKFIFDFHN